MTFPNRRLHCTGLDAIAAAPGVTSRSGQCARSHSLFLNGREAERMHFARLRHPRKSARSAILPTEINNGHGSMCCEILKMQLHVSLYIPVFLPHTARPQETASEYGANIMNKQSLIADRRWSCSLRIEWASNHSHVTKFYTGPRTWMDSWKATENGRT
jgi:hypothetical protein